MQILMKVEQILQVRIEDQYIYVRIYVRIYEYTLQQTNSRYWLQQVLQTSKQNVRRQKSDNCFEEFSSEQVSKGEDVTRVGITTSGRSGVTRRILTNIQSSTCDIAHVAHITRISVSLSSRLSIIVS
eukprot:TRINITY_DN3441_c0_g1_i13.p5 TRINITY_DN3441_c0_g1~~TRINITY_DN3441_c0_g1_i13.p5  ORF type:complete len:127 (-),score=3.62 TRINITY_DN3441_c0_g1_i13:870-1250(-)